MLEKNNLVELTIEDIDYEGLGIAHYDNHTIFVKNALPGEKVIALIMRVTSRIAFAKVHEFIKKASCRIESKCPYYRLCGGCNLLHVDYNEGLALKKKALEKTLEKQNGKLVICDIIPTKEYHYRNKVSLPIRNIDGKLVVGFYREGSHDLIPSDSCLIEDELSRNIVNQYLKLFNDNHLEAFNETSDTGLLKHFVIRTNEKRQAMVTIVIKNESKKLVDLLLQNPIDNVASVYLNINSKNTNVILGDKYIHVLGDKYLEETILGNVYKIHPNSFMQVNKVGMEILYKEAIRLLDLNKDDIVLDAYCGIGTISLSLARNVKKVIGVEIVPEAIINAKENAMNNNINNAEFYCGKAEDLINDLVKKESISKLIVDPPRKGVDVSFLDTIINQYINRIVYVSCNPATLSRDLSYLVNYGYEINHIQPVDMFAGSMHIETICLLTLK